MEFEPGAGPDELKKAVIAEFEQGAAPARVRLLLKTEGSGTLVPLVSRKQVAQMEQSVEGTFVTVEVQAYSECSGAFAPTFTTLLTALHPDSANNAFSAQPLRSMS